MPMKTPNLASCRGFPPLLARTLPKTAVSRYSSRQTFFRPSIRVMLMVARSHLLGTEGTLARKRRAHVRWHGAAWSRLFSVLEYDPSV